MDRRRRKLTPKWWTRRLAASHVLARHAITCWNLRHCALSVLAKVSACAPWRNVVGSEAVAARSVGREA